MPDETPVALVDAEGNFTEQFYETLEDDIKGAPVIREAGNVKNAVKMLVHGQRKLGKNRIPLPGDNATPEEWHDVYVQLGKPKTAGDYPYKRPKGVPKELRTPEHIKAAQEKAFKRNWTAKQWSDFMADEDARAIDDLKNKDILDQADLNKAEKELKEHFGMAYEERIHIADRLIVETTEEGAEREAFIAEFGRNPTFIKWAAKLGKTLVEHEALIAELTQQAPKEAQVELDELHASEDYQKYLRGELERTNPSKHKAIFEKEKKLYDIIYPTKRAG